MGQLKPVKMESRYQRSLRMLALRKDVTMQSLLHEAIEALLKKYGAELLAEDAPKKKGKAA